MNSSRDASQRYPSRGACEASARNGTPINHWSDRPEPDGSEELGPQGGCETRLSALDSALLRSTLFRTQVEGLGEALAAGRRVDALLGGMVENTRSTARCRHQAELSRDAGPDARAQYVASGSRERMMCPRCGNRRVV